jgi:iron complex outermembrane receptor protein
MIEPASQSWLRDGPRCRTFGAPAAAAMLSWAFAAAAVADDSSTSALKSLSVEERMNIEVTSVTKTAALLSTAPAAIYVITHEDVVRSGALEILTGARS